MLVGEAAAAGVDAGYREIETDQGPRRLPDRVGPAVRRLGAALADGLARGVARAARAAVVPSLVSAT